ncbi:MAG: hypothetical protein GY718_10020 [Lentisphaerae bacterium]|nr:hypothetical protein [Lentisphaerota bacterium]
MEKGNVLLHCSFCKKSEKEVTLLLAADIADPNGAYICSDCIRTSIYVIFENLDVKIEKFNSLEDDRLDWIGGL